jgi:hypothetical protein
MSGGFMALCRVQKPSVPSRQSSRGTAAAVACLAMVAPPLPVHAADAAACDSLDTARWVLGTWVADDGENSVIEEWRSVASGTFEGSGRTVSRKTGAVVSSESLRLVAMSSAVYYIAKVSHNAYPVAFALTTCTAGRLVFENPGHDFPKRIVYSMRPNDGIEVEVSDGRDQGFMLRFRHAD